MVYFDNYGNFNIVDTITETTIIARDSKGPIMNKYYITSGDDAEVIFWNTGDTTPNIRWGILNFDNFNSTNDNLNYDLLATIGNPNNFYNFGQFCVLLTCLNGGRNGLLSNGIKPISPNNEKNWNLSNNDIYINTDMTMLTDKNFAIYIPDKNIYYSLTFSIWGTGKGIPSNVGRVAYTRTLINIACFKSDTKIMTNKGYIPIQDLRKGDLVKTLKHDFKPIEMIGKREIYHPASKERIKDQLYKCSQSEYPEVFEDLIISGCHSILVDNFVDECQREKTTELLSKIYVTDNKYRLPTCLDDRSSVYDTPGTYTIYHLALENENYYGNYGIYANGLLVETCSNRYLKELSNMALIE